jgi:protein ImuA
MFGRAMFPAMVLANATQNAERRAQSEDRNSRFSLCTLRSEFCASGAVICCDSTATLYPPAIAAMGIPLDRLYLLHPAAVVEQTWAIAECLRCRGVAAVVASISSRLSRVEVRRLQLAAERGGGVGILLRPSSANLSSEYAAATRWLVTPARGERTVQRWKMQLIHGHGGRVGQAVFLEYHRDTAQTTAVRAIEQLADRSGETAA